MKSCFFILFLLLKRKYARKAKDCLHLVLHRPPLTSPSRQILAKVEADIDDQLADLRLTMDEVQDLTKRAGTLRKRGSDVEVVRETGGLKAAFTNVTSLELNFEDTPGAAGQASGGGRFVGGASKGAAGRGMSSCELAQHLMAAVPPGGCRPLCENVYIHLYRQVDAGHYVKMCIFTCFRLLTPNSPNLG